MLKIDLLPRHFAVARTNKMVLTAMIILLVLVLGGWMAVIGGVKSSITRVEKETEEIAPTAKEARDTQAEADAKQSELQPITDKVEFVAKADESGGQFWDRFHAVNEYIYNKAQITNFSVTTAGQVNFTATVGDTTECARFVLNLIRCPAISNVAVSGLPAGVSIEGAGGASMSFSPMGGGMGMGGPGMDPGMDPGMMAPGMEPGMDDPGMMGGGPQPSAGSSAAGEIVLSVTASLMEAVEEPTPPGMGGGGGAMGMGAMGGMGMDPGMGPGMDPSMDPGMAPPAGEEGPPPA